MLAQITQFNQTTHPPGWWIAAIVIGIIALYVFIKIEHVIVRLLCGAITLLTIAAVVWWFFLRH